MNAKLAATSLSAAALMTLAAPAPPATSAPEPRQSLVPEGFAGRRFQIPLGSGPLMGPETAKVTVLIFGGYECPFTAGANETVQSLLAAHPDDLRLQFIQAPLRFHSNSLPAARAVLAAGEQGKYWPMHQLLFASKQTAGERAPGRIFRRLDLTAADFERHAHSLGLDLARFRQDMVGPVVENKLEVDRATVESARIGPTPTLFINGRKIGGAVPAEQLIQVIREEIATADRLVKRGVAPAAVYNQLVGEASGARVAPAPAPMPRPASAANNGFESGTLGDWRVDNEGSGGWFVYTNGKQAPDPSSSDPRFPFEMPEPPEGRFAAVTDMKAPGTRILYRDVRLDGRYRLRATVFWTSAGPFAGPGVLDHTVTEANRLFRIDLVAATAPIDTVAKDQLLATVLKTGPSDPARRPPTTVTFDLSPWQGQVVRLRVASVDNRGPLRAGLDDVRFERLSP